MPFFYLVTGYTVILIIDKVLFDTHVILGGHDHGDNNRASVILKQSIALAMQNQGHEVTGVEIENALKKSISQNTKRS